MIHYHERCRCEHTRYLHAWVPDPQRPDDPQRSDCQACNCKAFDGTGTFAFDLESPPEPEQEKPDAN